MSTFVQFLLVVVITTLTFLVTFAGIQVFQILHEFRLAIKRINKILDNTQTLSEASAKPITAVNEFFSEVKDLVTDTEEEIIDNTPDRVITQKEEVHHHHKPVSVSRRFFHRSGLPLRPS
jgi:hypothetical protein